jgi:hypothetical protein
MGDNQVLCWLLATLLPGPDVVANVRPNQNQAALGYLMGAKTQMMTTNSHTADIQAAAGGSRQ